MAVSLEDIMNFMKKDKEERAKEREADKKEIKNMISSGVKKEVEENLQPIKEKQNLLEATQSNMLEKFNEMAETVQDLKTKLYSPSRSTSQGASPSWPTGLVSKPGQSGDLPQSSDLEFSDQQVADIISVARRTVGLSKIDIEDLNRMKQPQYGGATNEEEAKLLAVQEYLRCELKISQEHIENMKIDNIFTPEKDRDDPQYLNVTFRESSSVSKIYEKTRLMRKESRIINYIPKEFHERWRAISEFDYNIRLDRKYQTRVKMGWTGLELHKKLRGTGKWERVNLPNNLPPVNLNASLPSPARATPTSQSPPPGRPRHPPTPPSQSPSPGRLRHQSSRDKRERESSGSDSEQINPKVAKQSGEVTDGESEWVESVNNANLVTEGTGSPGDRNDSRLVLDPGQITSIQGTPAKAVPTYSHVASPILSSRSGKSAKQ